MVIAMKEFLDIVNAKGEPTGRVNLPGRLLLGTRLTKMEYGTGRPMCGWYGERTEPCRSCYRNGRR